jgi:very-short-patch-repair endonuclease
VKSLLPCNRKNVTRSRQLSNNSTEAEAKLWLKLRVDQVKGYRFCRQKPVGDYIMDFYCPKAKLIVEVDGGQRFTEAGAGNDKVRDTCLASLGIRVLRFPNNAIAESIDGVMEKILEAVG